MTPEAFEELLDRHGADLARWPHEARAAAEAFLTVSARANTQLAAMRDVEAYLMGSRATAGDGAYAAVAIRRARVRPARRVVSRAGWAAAAAAALAMGVFVGGATAAPRDDEGAASLAQALAPAESGYVD
jgi:hypothetical protein